MVFEVDADGKEWPLRFGAEEPLAQFLRLIVRKHGLYGQLPQLDHLAVLKLEGFHDFLIIKLGTVSIVEAHCFAKEVRLPAMWRGWRLLLGKS